MAQYRKVGDRWEPVSAASSHDSVDAGDSVGEVDAPSLVEEELADGEQLVDAEAGIVDPFDEDSDVLGHEV